MWRERDARYRGSRLSWAAGVVEDRGKNKIKGELEKGREGGRQRERERENCQEYPRADDP